LNTANDSERYDGQTEASRTDQKKPRRAFVKSLYRPESSLHDVIERFEKFFL
jgi:hypothetical protein